MGFIYFMGLMLLSGCSTESAKPFERDPRSLHPGGETTNTLLLGVNAFARPAENITREHQLLFFTGNSFFNLPWVQSPSSTIKRDGLGPLFNARACAACHFRDGRAAPPETPDDPLGGLLFRLSLPGAAENEAPIPDPHYGDQFQPESIDDVASEGDVRVSYVEVPGEYADGTQYSLLQPIYEFVDLNFGPLASDMEISPRIAPHVIGLGLLEAIEEADLLRKTDPNDVNGDGVSGRANYVYDEIREELNIGRFGWKSEMPTVRQQVAGAFNGDIGITTSMFPDNGCTDMQDSCLDAFEEPLPEIEDRLLDRVVLYTSMLAVPARRYFQEDQVIEGEIVFRDLGCDSCHTPSYVTGDHEFAELSSQMIWPYTDLLLHDMGPGLADGRPVYAADGFEWRTPPLWGLGLLKSVNGHTRLLHDGRARGFAEAILWHGGEAENHKNRFKQLPEPKRTALIRFLESL